MRFSLLALLLIAGPALAEPARSVPAPDVTICFTPGEDCQARIIDAVRGARKQILVQAYGFTSPPILGALKLAKPCEGQHSEERQGVQATAPNDHVSVIASAVPGTASISRKYRIYINYLP